VIVDADMRRPRLHTIFGLDNGEGLSNILASKMSEAEILCVVQQHEESGLYVLTSGRIPPNPAELLGSDQVRALMKVLENTFTHVVIDSRQLLPLRWRVAFLVKRTVLLFGRHAALPRVTSCVAPGSCWQT